ncbi:MAG TPA: hypothetical protein VFI27_17855 [candidate division Zixibacteria bacterium]|nr:hypothetical protein [candidate division Zixibacteria bacterium]
MNRSTAIRARNRMTILAGFLVFISIFLLSFDTAIIQENNQNDPRFGVAEAFWSPEEAAELGVGWERILFYWREIQPQGPDDWNTLHVREEWLDDAERNDREVVGLLKNTAPWASEDGTEAGVPVGLDLPIDDPDNYWANYARRIAQYYGPLNVHNWIIWNEPEITSDTYGFEFAGSVEEYYRLLKVAYQVIKEEDPQATIHLAGVTWWHDQTFLRRLFEVALADPEAGENDWFFDVISLHIYFRPETVYSIIQEVQALQDAYGIDKPIWLNETNAPPNRDPLWPVDRPAFTVDLDQQAWFIAQATALAFSAGTERIAIYKLADVMLPEGAESFGLLRQDSSRRPAYAAYATAIEYLDNFSQVTLKQHPHYYVATFSSPGFITRVAWARTVQEVTLRFPALSDEATLVDVTGNSATITGEDGEYLIALQPAVCHDDCLIGGAPVYIVEEYEVDDILQIETAIAFSGVEPTLVALSTATRFLTSTPVPTFTSIATTSSTPTTSPLPSPSPTETQEPQINVTIEASDNDQDEDPLAIPSSAPANTPSESPPSQTDAINTAEEDIPGTKLDDYLGIIFLLVAMLLLAFLVIFINRRRT